MLTMVVGAQYGGEGKGKICAYLASRKRYQVACRCGGVNSSHTVVDAKGKSFKLRMIPAAAVVDPNVSIVYGAGSLIHIPTLLSEMNALDIDPKRVKIDPRAGVVTQELIDEQRRDGRYIKIGSTLTGTGYASAERCKRRLKLAREFDEIKCMLEHNIIEYLVDMLRLENGEILLEGHQGFGLSNYHGDYPYVSSRDCTAAELLSEVGLGPQSARHMRIILAVKAFPTRNHDGDLGEELSRAEIRRRGIAEKGGGSWGIGDQCRRVGKLDLGLVRQAAYANSATEIALTGADYLDRGIASASQCCKLPNELEEMVANLESVTGLKVVHLSTGPETQSMIERGQAARLHAA